MLAEVPGSRGGRVAVVDYAGHAFPVELSRALAGAGYRVLHLSCPDVASGHGRLDRDAADPPHLSIEAVPLGSEVERYRFATRAAQELSWGRLALRRLRSWHADVVLLANIPLLAQTILVPGCRRAGAAPVLWQQDVHTRAAADILRRRLGRPGAVVAAGFGVAERRCARGSSAVVTITEDFVPLLRAWGVPAEKILVQPNWAPLAEIVPAPKDNFWARAHGLADRPVAMYAGTLSYKHDPHILVELARSFAGRRDRRCVAVVTQGIGRDYLQSALAAEPDLPLVLLDFQPYGEIVEMLAAADVLVALLERAAGSFSVPSKILSYLCAGRPVVASVPSENQAAILLAASGAGTVVDTGDPGGVVRAVEELLADPAVVAARGRAARDFAESRFDIKTIWPAFAEVIDRVRAERGAGRRAR